MTNSRYLWLSWRRGDVKATVAARMLWHAFRNRNYMGVPDMGVSPNIGGGVYWRSDGHYRHSMFYNCGCFEDYVFDRDPKRSEIVAERSGRNCDVDSHC